VHYFSVLSSSEYGTFCNGMYCPPGSSCVVSVSVINGNKTSNKRCSNINGKYKLYFLIHRERLLCIYVYIYKYIYMCMYVCVCIYIYIYILNSIWEVESSHSHSPGTAYTMMMEAASSPEVMITIHHLTWWHIQE